MKKIGFSLMLLISMMSMAQFGMRLPSGEIGNSKWTFGGYAGLTGGFGSGGGLGFYLSPRVGYKLGENVEAGLGGNLTWSNSSYASSTMVGVGPFINYYIARKFYLTGNLQEFFINQKIKSTDQKFSVQETALYLGGGYMQKLGERAYMQIGGMYNVLHNPNKSYFSTGFIPQVGIVYGL